MMMPPASPRMATTAKGTRNHAGRIVVRAPMGSVLMAWPSSASEPTRRMPKKTSTTQGSADPSVVQPMTPAVEALRGR